MPRRAHAQKIAGEPVARSESTLKETFGRVGYVS